MKLQRLFAIVVLWFATAALVQAAPPAATTLRPPAVPLVTSDPYLSIWSEADRLTDDTTRHWTRREHSLVSLIRVDDKAYRLMGKEPEGVAALAQVGLKVWPTRTVYDFEGAGVHVTFTFMSPALPTDLEVLARPLTYLTWEVRSADGKPHHVAIYDSVSSQLAVNKPEQKVTWAREPAGEITALRVGTVDQPLLNPPGDDTRIDWGYAYLAAPARDVKAAIGGNDALEKAFVDGGALPADDDKQMPRSPVDNQPVMAMTFDMGEVGNDPAVRHAMVAYDEVWSIKYFGKKLRPYWRRDGATPADLFQAAERDYPALIKRCEAFDRDLMNDMTKVGGEKYAQIAALAYRQTLAGCGLAADANKQPLLFTKENTSNGDIATVDVIFPMEPIFIFLSPTLAKASLVSVLDYSATPRWKFPNAPHDLGTYPVVMGRDDGGEGMPVEESGNMLILCDAIAQAEGNAQFVDKWWPQLTQWAKYLEQYGLDPENQLCTDDFMGHLAHNSNLSIKAILGLAAYGDLCHMRGDEAGAQKYRELAKKDAEHWIKVADAGDHSLLAFDKPNTWSQKYNLVWDQLLGLNVFPPEVASKEVSYYLKKMQKYGVPLDSRTKLTKTDWSVWSATMAQDRADFEAMISPIFDYLNQTTTRDPLADSYVTDNVKSGGMHARPVVGGIFIKMLSDRAIWKKWASADKQKVGPWAELPAPPQVTVVVPTAQEAPVQWRYTFEKPPADWTKPDFDASKWKEGSAPFGTRGTPGVNPRTIWRTPDIYLRREVTIPAGNFPQLKFWVIHDEDVEIYVNGVLAADEGEFVGNYVPLEIRSGAMGLMKPGEKVTIAVHCHQTVGGQSIDVGLANVVEQP